MDSPGFSAQFCSYVSIENNTKKIVSMLTLDKRETDKKSPCLEKEGFVRSMAAMEAQGLNVVEVVTDAHMSIAAVMSKFNSRNTTANSFLYIDKFKLKANAYGSCYNCCRYKLIHFLTAAEDKNEKEKK